MIYNVLFKDIVWDLSDEDDDTIDSLIIPVNEIFIVDGESKEQVYALAEEEGADWLSDKHGWCVRSIGDIVVGTPV